MKKILIKLILAPLMIAGIFTLTGGTNSVNTSENSIQPNLLFVYADQWRRMAVSYYEHPRFDGTYNQGDPVSTPNLDQCANEGMIFHNAVVVSPICSPNRATLMTGLYPSSHGLIDNSNYEGFSHENETVAHVLGSNGYETAHIGKWHISMTELAKFNETPAAQRGFDYWYGSPVHNHQHFDARLYHDKNEIDGLGEYGIGGKQLPNPFVPSLHYKDEALRKQESWNPDHLTRKALDYLNNTYNVREIKKPFALYVSYNPPHTIHGYIPAVGNEGSWHISGQKNGEQYYGHMDEGEPDYDYRAPMKYEARYRQGNNHSDPVRTDLRRRPNVPEDHYSATKCLPGYYGAVNSIDDCFGLLDKYLETTPDPRYPDKKLKETTIVIITADHGEMMGSHERMTKGIPLEESIGVPFIIRWPGQVPAGTEESMVFNSVDVAPSLLGLLGLEFSGQVDGVDRNSVFLGKDENKCEHAFLSLRKWRAVRTKDEVYVVEFHNINKPLITYYNLTKDPFQMEPIYIQAGNRFKKPGKKLQKHLTGLHETLRQKRIFC
jgi:arylsulfatase A-like enzyme